MNVSIDTRPFSSTKKFSNTECSDPNPSSIIAGPPLEKFRKLNAYRQCLVNSDAPENNSYNETPFVPQELPDQSSIGLFDILSGMFVIPYNRPTTILVSKEIIPGKKVVRCRTQRRGNLPFERRKQREKRLVHTFLSEAGPVIAAGEFEIQEDMYTVKISNDSGHYLPPPEVLNYAKCVFQSKGYFVIPSVTFPKKKDVSPFLKNAKTLLEWEKTPYGEWYVRGTADALAAGAGTGGKRKTRRKKINRNS
jgi:hypothetical protein